MGRSKGSQLPRRAKKARGDDTTAATDGSEAPQPRCADRNRSPCVSEYVHDATSSVRSWVEAQRRSAGGTSPLGVQRGRRRDSNRGVDQQGHPRCSPRGVMGAARCPHGLRYRRCRTTDRHNVSHRRSAAARIPIRGRVGRRQPSPDPPAFSPGACPSGARSAGSSHRSVPEARLRCHRRSGRSAGRPGHPHRVRSDRRGPHRAHRRD